MIKNVIFDMDGVLIDSEDAITLAGVEALNERGIPAKYEDFKQFTGMGENKFIGGVAELYGVPYELSMKDRTYEIYVETARERVSVYPWSNKLTASLVREGFGIAVASAADMVKVRCNLECIGADESLFSAIITGSDVEKKKPDPEIFLKAAHVSGFDPAYSLVIEDALSGVRAAKAAGMKCLGLTTSFTAEELFATGADHVEDGIDDIESFIEEIKTW